MPFGNTKKIYFIIKLIQKTQLKLISIAITINKKTRNMIYLRKRMYRFSWTRKQVIKKAAAGIIKFRNISSQKLKIFEHFHSPNNDLQRTSQEYCIGDTKIVMPNYFDLNNSLSTHTHTHTHTTTTTTTTHTRIHNTHTHTHTHTHKHTHTHTLFDKQSSPIQAAPLHFT